MGHAGLTELLACPACHGSLTARGEELDCTGCGRTFPVRDGIPVLLVDADDGHKQLQAAYFDDEGDPEFEITRPFGAPAFHRYLLEEKFRRGVSRLGSLAGETVAVVCGGSGMDAHFLARAGARAISVDISLGAALRARERARRFGVGLEPVVADAERLPFADRSIPVVYVHDGLHHLEHPQAGLLEMARVAARAVSITEPARAALTALAVRAGLALEREEAGNTVARLDLAEIQAGLRGEGFRIVAARRYAMLYRHEPGRPMRALSAPPLEPLARAGLRAIDLALGRVGNKLTVQALRA